MKLQENTLKNWGLQIDALNTIQGGVATTLVNIQAEKDGQVVEIRTPSVKMESYQIELINNLLLVYIFFPKNTISENVPMMTRAFPISPLVDTERIEATFEPNHVLRIFLPNKENAQAPRKIDIKYRY